MCGSLQPGGLEWHSYGRKNAAWLESHNTHEKDVSTAVNNSSSIPEHGDER
jgi:hypothetical protein